MIIINDEGYKRNRVFASLNFMVDKNILRIGLFKETDVKNNESEWETIQNSRVKLKNVDITNSYIIDTITKELRTVKVHSLLGVGDTTEIPAETSTGDLWLDTVENKVLKKDAEGNWPVVDIEYSIYDGIVYIDGIISNFKKAYDFIQNFQKSDMVEDSVYDGIASLIESIISNNQSIFL